MQSRSEDAGKPLVTIVTPTLNAAQFLETAIQSVLTQDYPHIEYLVVDGGSRDGTLDILESHADRLTCIAGMDTGTADALNKGFARAHGQVFAWLSADDAYLPGAITKAVEGLAANPDAAAVYGEGYWMDGSGKVLGRYPTGSCDGGALGGECCICQPTCFIRRQAMEAVGMLDAALRCSFDYDLWVRLAKEYRLARISEALATSRMHADTLTIGRRRAVFTESIEILQRHFGYVPVRWVYGYLSYLRDQRDQVLQPLRHSAWTYLLALPKGLSYNSAHPLRYAAEWISALEPSRLRRGWMEQAGTGFPVS